MTVVELLKKTPVSKILPPGGKVITFKSDENPRDAYQKLADHNIRSAPVYDIRTSRFIGFLDIRDLLAFVVYENNEPALRSAVASKGTTTEFIERMLTAGAQMYDLPMEAVSLSTLARRNGFHCVGEDASLDDVAKLLVHKGCHRVAVMNDDGDIVNIVSQSSIIKFLTHSRLGGMGDHTVAQSACGTSPVLSVNARASVIEAFTIMVANDIMGVAVVDDSGKLIANTSATDLKQFLRDPSLTLDISVLEFISRVRQHDVQEVHPAMGVSKSDTLSHVLGKLAAARVHRLFVVEKGRATAVISLTDILRYFYLVSLIKGDD